MTRTRTEHSRKTIHLAHATLLLTMLCCASRGAELVKDINEQPAVRQAGTKILGHVGPDVIFSAGYQFFPTDFPSDASLGLWRSDGTAAGTQRILANGAPPAFSSPRRLASVGSHVLWIAEDPADEVTNARRRALWASDGTAAGTARLAALPGSFDASEAVVGVLPGDVVVFGISPTLLTGSAELWRSDGTAAGTWRLATYQAGGQVPAGARIGDRLYFAGRGAEGTELWVTDGSNVPANTHLFADLEPGPDSSGPAQFTAVGNDVYFTAFTGGVARLWQLDAAANLTPLTSTSTASIQCTAGNLIYFTLAAQPAAELWRTDGTVAGTLPLLTQANPNGGALKEGGCRSRGDRVFFPTLSGGIYRLWQSDGTAVGTTATSFAQGSASMRLLHWSGSHWFVATADQGSHLTEQLWATDGATDTRLVAIDAPASAIYFLTLQAAGLGQHVVFTTRFIGPVGPSPSSPLPPPVLQLWRADADGKNPLRLAPDVYADTLADGHIAADAGEFLLTTQRLFYRSKDELSVTDGTPAGTTVLRQLMPNGTGASSSREFVTVGATSLFLADDGLTGPELWRTDGTSGGTTQIMDIKPGAAGGAPAHLRAIDHFSYFDADDGVHGRELWVSDGTTTGTRMLADNLPGPAGWTFDDCPSTLKFDGFVYFGARNSAGPELWRTDGTAAGTTSFFKTGQPGIGQICPQPLAAIGSALYFAANGLLWRTDGSTAGTQQVSGFAGPLQLFPSLPAQFRGELVVASLSAQVANSGRTSLWSVANAAPRLVIDLADPALGPGVPAPIAWLIASDNTLYFAVAGSSSNPRTGLYKWAGGAAAPERFSGITVSVNGWVRKFGSRIVFNGSSAATGEEVFVSDGSVAGTSAITDVSAAGEAHVHDAAFVLGPALYFQYVDTISGPTQLARSNGTLASFERLTDFVWGSAFPLGSADGQLIFATDDVRETVGNEPYVVGNQKPQAAADSATVVAGQSVAITLAANDSDTDGQVIASGARVVAAPAHGAVTINADGTATYQADASFAGTDTFSYVAADNGGRESAPATVTVTVQAAQGGSATGSSGGGGGGGGSSGWLLIVSLGLFVLRQRVGLKPDHAADSGV